MRVTVSSRHTEVSDGLRAAAVEKIGRLQRFLDGMDSAEVHFSEEKNRRIADREICEVTLAGHGHHIRCKVAAPDGLAAVDLAVDKLEHQLHRLKTRLKGRSGAISRRSGNGPLPAAGALPAPADDPDDSDHSMADDAHITRDGTAIVKKKSFALAPMAIDQAVLRLDLLDHDFFLFTNAATGRSAVLYRRHEGGLGLIEQA
jgi:putative sigma-54 modulation protein